jgi:hypothetical protein
VYFKIRKTEKENISPYDLELSLCGNVFEYKSKSFEKGKTQAFSKMHTVTSGCWFRQFLPQRKSCVTSISRPAGAITTELSQCNVSSHGLLAYSSQSQRLIFQYHHTRGFPRLEILLKPSIACPVLYRTFSHPGVRTLCLRVQRVEQILFSYFLVLYCCRPSASFIIFVLPLWSKRITKHYTFYLYFSFSIFYLIKMCGIILRRQSEISESLRNNVIKGSKILQWSGIFSVNNRIFDERKPGNMCWHTEHNTFRIHHVLHRYHISSKGVPLQTMHTFGERGGVKLKY